jgi:hypothetical protein
MCENRLSTTIDFWNAREPSNMLRAATAAVHGGLNGYASLAGI